MSVQHRERYRTRHGTRGSGRAETIVRIHPGRDADAGMFAVHQKDPFASNRTQSV